jgi:hypothetical protein
MSMRKVPCIVVCAIAAVIPLGAETVPVPETARLAVSADSYPFNTASHDLVPLDLAKRGYSEEEFIVSGTANVYEWGADGSLTVKTAKAPYADRILLRHPSNSSRFSGTVIVELMNPARRFDWPMMWGYSHDYFMEHGDAWVGITMPGSVQGLKKFNPTRYAAVGFANRAPGSCAAGKKGAPDQEEGLRWDMISQVAAALKSGTAGSPMAGFKVQRVFLTTQAGDLVTYINAIHAHAMLANGKPAYDGYLIKNPGSAARISQCAAAPAQGDARRVVHPVSVPIVSVVAQGEVIGSLASRRDDSDDPQGRYRLYEIAGVAHIEKYPYSALPSFADQIAAVGAAQGTPEWPFNAKCNPEIPLGDDPLLKYSYDAAFFNLDQWVAKGVAPPKAERIQVKDRAIVLDEFGNGAGGVRSPFVDVPVATYFTTSPGPGTCAELGHSARFDEARMSQLYPGGKTYSAKVTASIEKMQKERYLTAADAKQLKEELLKPAK